MRKISAVITILIIFMNSEELLAEKYYGNVSPFMIARQQAETELRMSECAGVIAGADNPAEYAAYGYLKSTAEYSGSVRSFIGSYFFIIGGALTLLLSTEMPVGESLLVSSPYFAIGTLFFMFDRPEEIAYQQVRLKKLTALEALDNWADKERTSRYLTGGCLSAGGLALIMLGIAGGGEYYSGILGIYGLFALPIGIFVLINKTVPEKMNDYLSPRQVSGAVLLRPIVTYNPSNRDIFGGGGAVYLF